MAKMKATFICQECGYESSGWLGKCPACNQWNTFVEEVQRPEVSKNTASFSGVKPVSIGNIEITSEERYSTGMKEMDRVLGGGVVKGSLVLVGGDPGIGKSTLLLQLCERVGDGQNIIYFSGEESIRQVKMRADRLGVRNPNLYIVAETNFNIIENIIQRENPVLVVIDSIQTMFKEELTSAPGSVSQVREVTAGLMRLAKGLNVAILIVGHVTKEGAIAGPRVLEHMVDTVLYFEGERHATYRVMRAVKNRFGSTNEMGIFEMKELGLVEVENPSMALLAGRPHDVPGSSIISSIEGTRPMLLEVQALVSPTSFGVPRRMATGADYNRVILLMAVLEKRVGLQLGNQDAYVNIVGGIKIDEPSADLGIIMAIASSFRNRTISGEAVFIGEVGLTGEIRMASYIEKRVMEAARSGFKQCFIPKGNMEQVKGIRDIRIIGVENVQEALEHVLQ